MQKETLWERGKAVEMCIENCMALFSINYSFITK